MTETRYSVLESDLRIRDLQRIEELTGAQKHEEAFDAISALLQRLPFDRAALYWAAVNERLLEHTNSALEILDALQKMYPHYGLQFQERGNCYVALGDQPRAVEAFENAVHLNPALMSSWEMLEQLLEKNGAPERASIAAQHLKKLQELPPEIVEAGSLFCDGDFEIAERHLTDFVVNNPRHSEALRLLGRIAQRRGALCQAELYFKEAVEGAPEYVDARFDYVRVLIERQKYSQALEQIDELSRIAPSDLEASFLRATVLAGLERHGEAVPVFRQLIAACPERSHYQILLGNALKALGRSDDAIQAYRSAASGQSGAGEAYWSLANLKTYRFDDGEIERMRALDASPAQRPDRAQLCFALGKALEDRGEYGSAWSFYQRGNALARAASDYRHRATELNAQRLTNLFTRAFFAARAGAGATARDPIFVVGLPRTGSTLLEQILASHADVEGTQERHDIRRIVAEMEEAAKLSGGSSYPEVLEDIDTDVFRNFGERYLDETEELRRGKSRFVDKLPNNFWHIGLIHLILPNAKIIDMRREPMACAVANLRQFYARGGEFSYGIGEIAGYYRTYLDLMRHWDDVLPDRVLRVHYEDLVEDLEASVRRVLDYCELDFDPACLEFHRTERVVNTPSSEQVRQPLFRDGLSNWRRFEPWLDPLRAALGDALSRYKE